MWFRVGFNDFSISFVDRVLTVRMSGMFDTYYECYGEREIESKGNARYISGGSWTSQSLADQGFDRQPCSKPTGK